MSFNRGAIIKFLLWSVLSFLFLFLFSYSTSPFYSISWGHDSAVFQIIGKGWIEGLIPYRDSFDHKGPLLFAFNAIGYLIGGKTGLFFLQGVFMLAFLEVSYRIFRLFLKELLAIILPVVMQIILCRTFDEGNMTEEWSLLFLAVSFYYLIKWLKTYQDGKKTHPPFYAFIYGICFACILFLRVTNAIGICCCVLIIALFLVINGCWKNLLQNIVSILCGVLLVIVPFCIYFYAKGCLYDMWYATILFNLSYGMENGLVDPADDLRVYAGGEERGKAMPVSVPGGKNLQFVSVSGDMAGERLVFVLVKADGARYRSVNDLRYAVNGVLGTLDKPYALSFEKEMAEHGDVLWSVSPNPVKDKAYVDVQLAFSAEVQLEVLNQNGMVLYAGTERVDGYARMEVDLEGFPAGNYIVRLTVSGETYIEKLIKL